MLAHKGAGADEAEALLLQQEAELQQRVVVIAVAEDRQEDRGRVMALDGLDIGQQKIGQPARVDGQADDGENRFRPYGPRKPTVPRITLRSLSVRPAPPL